MEVDYFVLNVSNKSGYSQQDSARDVFDFLVKEHETWGVRSGLAHVQNLKTGDKVLFYLAGKGNQTFAGAATLASEAYYDESSISSGMFLDPQVLILDLRNVILFDPPKPRKVLTDLSWRPAQGSCTKISRGDYNTILRAEV